MSSKVMAAQEHSVNDRTNLGFWIYIMTDCILFATLFATFAVLRNNTFGGPSGADIFSLSYVFIQTVLLLVSSLTIGLALLAAYRGNRALAIMWMVVTFALGAGFLVMELREFTHLYQESFSWRRSAFLSSYFALVGTHGLHITAGLIWIGTMIAQLYKKGTSPHVLRRVSMLSMFWHFLDIVWIFIFTVVYLMGAVK